MILLFVFSFLGLDVPGNRLPAVVVDGGDPITAPHLGDGAFWRQQMWVATFACTGAMVVG